MAHADQASTGQPPDSGPAHPEARRSQQQQQQQDGRLPAAHASPLEQPGAAKPAAAATAGAAAGAATHPSGNSNKAAGAAAPAAASSLQPDGTTAGGEEAAPASHPLPTTLTTTLAIPRQLRLPGLALRAVVIQQLAPDGRPLRAQLCIHSDEAAQRAAGPTDGRAPKRRRKAPDAPKKPMTAYLVFSVRNRSRVLAANPGVTVQELTKLLAAEWKQVSPEELAECEEAVARDRERYDGEMAAYRQAQDCASDQAAGRKAAEAEAAAAAAPAEAAAVAAAVGPKAQKAGGAARKGKGAAGGPPAKARTAYNLFSADQRKGLPPDIGFGQANRIVGDQWQAASEETRALYQARADQERARHAELAAAGPVTLTEAAAAAAEGAASQQAAL